MSYSQFDGRSRFRVTSPWGVVVLLWFCGFFNYADRQAVTSVFPLLTKEFGLSKTELGMLGSAFMVVYACSAPLAGFVVDKVSRRSLVVSGLAFWSLVCAATGMARSFNQLVFFRAAEGLGESFYFPASMSILADYHGPRTRSRAMSLHQTSVYIGTAGGGLLAGVMGELWGWQSPFWLLGIIGIIYAGLIGFWIVEPKRGQSDEKPLDADEEFAVPTNSSDFFGNVSQVIRVPAAVALLAVFAGANFVATAFLTWLTAYIFEKFNLGLGWSSLTSTFFPLASLVGAVCGGVLADIAARRAGGRMRVQGAALLVGAPFLYLAGSANTIPLFVAGLIGVGLCKGVYDANIFASIYDVVPSNVRGTAAGLMNTIGWAGGSLSPLVIGLGADRVGLGTMIASMAVIYAIFGLLAFVAGYLAQRKTPASGGLGL